MTPIIIAKLGLAGYGTWTLLFSVCAYVSMFNTSAGMAYSKFTAEYDQANDHETLSQIISAGVALLGVIGLIGLSAAWLAGIPLLRFVNVPNEMILDASTSLLLVALAVLLRMTFGCVFQVLAGLQRIDLNYKLNIFASFVEFVLAVGLLTLNFGLTALALAHLAGQIITTAIGWRICHKLRPGIRLSVYSINRAGLRIMFSLAGRFQGLSLISTAFTHGLNFAIAALCGVSNLGIFDLANKLLRLGMTLSGAIIAPLMPAFANLQSGNDRSRWYRLYMFSSKAVAYMATLCFVGLAVFADLIVTVWTGESYPLAAWTIRTMAVGHFLVLMTGVGTASLRGKGTVKLEIVYSTINICLVAVLIFPAYLIWDYQGIVVSILISLCVASTFFLIRFAVTEGIGVATYLREIVWGLLAVGPLATAIGLFLRPGLDALMPNWSVRWQALFEVVLAGGTTTGALATVLWFALFSASDRSYLLQRLLKNKDRSDKAKPDLA